MRPELAITSQYTCYSYNSYFGGYLGTGKCVSESSGRWTGNVSTSATPAQSCYAKSSHVLRFTQREQRYVATHEGVSYSASVSAGALGSQLEVSATYGSGTEVRLNFDQGGKKRHFCVGGNKAYVADSAELYVNRVKVVANPDPCVPHLPCGRGSE